MEDPALLIRSLAYLLFTFLDVLLAEAAAVRIWPLLAGHPDAQTLLVIAICSWLIHATRNHLEVL